MDKDSTFCQISYNWFYCILNFFFQFALLLIIAALSTVFLYVQSGLVVLRNVWQSILSLVYTINYSDHSMTGRNSTSAINYRGVVAFDWLNENESKEG